MSGGDSDKAPEVMDEKREKRSLLRRGCARLARALFRCVIPCVPVDRRRRGHRDSAEERNAAASPAMAIHPADDERRASLGGNSVLREPTIFSCKNSIIT